MILKSFRNMFFYLRTYVTLCRVHNMVLDDVHNVAHLPTMIIVSSSNSVFPLAILVMQEFPL
jgi:hypothetical protein